MGSKGFKNLGMVLWCNISHGVICGSFQTYLIKTPIFSKSLVLVS